MIHIESMGGFGNQLFIYAMARAIQLETGEGITLYDYHRTPDVPHVTRQLERVISPQANIRFVEKTPDDLPYYLELAPIRSFLFRALRKAYLAAFCRRSTQPDYQVEKALAPFWNRLGFYFVTDGYVPLQRLSRWKDCFYQGYFQSRKFWGAHTDELRAELRHPELIALESTAYLTQIQNTNSICLHIRLGDYVNNPAARRVHYVCDETYYQKAVQAAMERLENPTFFAFSNEPDKAKAIPFPTGANIVWLPEGDAVSDLQLMAQCRHFIVANSSYSWWAQLLGAAPDKTVYAPQRWFRSDKPVDLYEDDWILIPITQLPAGEVKREN